MKEGLVSKGLALSVIMLFVGSGIVPSYGTEGKSINLAQDDKIITIIDSNYIKNDVYVSASKFLKNIDSLNYYGFIINVSAYQNLFSQTNICKLINSLFQENVTVYWICENISVLSKSMNEKSEIINRSFEKGTFIVPFTNNSDLNSIATIIVKEYNISKNIEIYHLNEPIKNLKIHILIEPKIAHYYRPGIDCESYFICLSEAGFSNQKVLTSEDVLNNLTIDNFNVVIIGGQNETDDKLIEYFKLINFFVNWKIRKYVKSGGGYIGSCAGGLKAASGYKRPKDLPVSFSWILYKFIPLQNRILDRPVYLALPGGGGSMSENNCSGVILKIVNHSCPVSFGLPYIITETNYWGGPMFLEGKDGSPNSENLAVIEGLDENGWNWNFDMSYHVPWWILLPENYKKQLIQRWIDYSKGKALWITSKFGDGKIVAFGDHPEYCAYEWADNLKRIVYNAVLYVSSKGPFFIDIDYVRPLL